MRDFFVSLYKIFFVGLLFQFVAWTFVTYTLGLDQSWMSLVRLWKEAVIALLGILTLGYIIRKKSRKQLVGNKVLGRWTLGLIASAVLAGVIHIVILQQPISTFVYAFKYDFIGFFILLIALHSSVHIEEQDMQDFYTRCGKFLKRCLLAALVRYFIIFVKPGTLKLIGYDNFVFEGLAGAQPPAVYYTLINHGVPRNQFLFERPITRGFYLVALFPFFFVQTLRKQRLRDTRARWLIYGINVILTFSRAAWGVWIIELGLIGALFYKKHIKKFFAYIIVPLLLVIGLIGYTGYKQVFERSYSTTGHVNMLTQGVGMLAEAPLFGHGGASAGPGSHREDGNKFNPENQFLQIAIEFGLIGFLPRALLFASLIGLGFHRTNDRPYLLAVSMGLLGLAISGMVLHSFSDRMVVYPFMLLFGIVWGSMLKDTLVTKSV